MDRPSALTLQAISAEVVRARMKFPANAVLLAALMEEVGELANAFLELRFASLRTVALADIDLLRDKVQKEAIQVAAVAVRILEEGTSEFPQYQAPGAGK